MSSVAELARKADRAAVRVCLAIDLRFDQAEVDKRMDAWRCADRVWLEQAEVEAGRSGQ